MEPAKAKVETRSCWTRGKRKVKKLLTSAVQKVVPKRIRMTSWQRATYEYGLQNNLDMRLENRPGKIVPALIMILQPLNGPDSQLEEEEERVPETEEATQVPLNEAEIKTSPAPQQIIESDIGMMLTTSEGLALDMTQDMDVYKGAIEGVKPIDIIETDSDTDEYQKVNIKEKNESSGHQVESMPEVSNQEPIEEACKLVLNTIIDQIAEELSLDGKQGLVITTDHQRSDPLPQILESKGKLQKEAGNKCVLIIEEAQDMAEEATETNECFKLIETSKGMLVGAVPMETEKLAALKDTMNPSEAATDGVTVNEQEHQDEQEHQKVARTERNKYLTAPAHNSIETHRELYFRAVEQPDWDWAETGRIILMYLVPFIWLWFIALWQREEGPGRSTQTMPIGVQVLALILCPIVLLVLTLGLGQN